jgi:hypothetical protein
MFDNQIKENQILYASKRMMMTILIVAISAAQLSSTVVSNGDTGTNAYAKYSNSQASSLVNECSEDRESNKICVNSNPQTQGKDNVVSAPISSQTQKPNPLDGEEGPEQELQVREVEGNMTQIEMLDDGTAIAECDSDEFVTGGGYAIFGVVSDAVIQQESAVSGPPAGWYLFVTNTGPSTIEVQAFAECAELVDTS